MNKKFFILFIFLSFAYFSMAQEGNKSGSMVGTNLLSLLSDNGKLIPDVETNSILVVDTPSNIAMVEEYLKMADKPSQQVLIEARLVEVKLEGEHSLGVNWSILSSRASKIGEFEVYSIDSTGTAYYPYQAIPFRQPKWEPLSGDDQQPFTFGIFNENINVIVKTLATQLDTKILSAPKITTVNNRRAKIDIVKTIPYLEEIEKEDEDTETGTRTTFTYTYSYADEGVTLEVTPLINPDGTITMTLFPQVKEIIRFKELPGPEGASRLPQLPETDVRFAQTKVTIKAGQTLVIGGLIREKKTKGITKVPLLGDFPLLGFLFRSKIDTKQKTELLILISPTIITPHVLENMDREERLGIGKWYMDERKKHQRDLAYQANKKFISLIDSLSQEVKELSDERKLLEKSINKEKEKLQSIIH